MKKKQFLIQRKKRKRIFNHFNKIPNELKELGYNPPVIKPYDKNGVKVWIDQSTYEFPIWRLSLNGIQWMVFDPTHGQTKQFYSHYNLAYGHVVCTGLGFGTREKWLSAKPEVTKITVIEAHKPIIDYHKNIGTEWSDKIEIIHCDANDYKGKCDFLSLDHYEFNDVQSIINSIKKVAENIEHKSLWFWMLEPWIKNGIIQDNTENPNIIPIGIKYDGIENDIQNNYGKIKKFLDLRKLPDLETKELVKFINMYYGK